jgi:hypothetical protein
MLHGTPFSVVEKAPDEVCVDSQQLQYGNFLRGLFISTFLLYAGKRMNEVILG